jgi:hypothetical protein
MRVFGPAFSLYTRLGFSPHAILIVGGAPGNATSSEVRPCRITTVKPSPPIRFAEPGRLSAVVTPPCAAREICGSCGEYAYCARACAVTGALASLPSSFARALGAAYTPMCECVSMRPGVT